MSYEYIEIDDEKAACIAHCLAYSKVGFSFEPVADGFNFKVNKKDRLTLDDCVREGCGPDSLPGFKA